MPGQSTSHVASLTTHAQTRWKCQVSKATALTEQWVLFLSQLQPPTMRVCFRSLSLSYSLSPCPVMLSVAFKESFMPAGLLGAKAFGKYTTAPKGAAGYFAKATSAECVCTCSARVCMCLKSYRELLRRALEGYSGKVLGKKHFLRKFVTFSFILC